MARFSMVEKREQMKPGDIVQVCPADILDPEAVRLQGMYFRVTLVGGLPLGLGMVSVMRLNSRKRYVFREQDLKACPFSIFEPDRIATK